MTDSMLTGCTALITGASSGLGADFARELARHGARPVLVARREDRLRSLADELKRDHGVESVVVAMDLGEPTAAQTLFEQLQHDKVAVDVLVNNAGFGLFGRELDLPWERTNAMLQLDIVTLTHLTKLFAREMVKRERGWILQVASIGAYQPSPTYAAYSAAKSYVLSFGQALNHELKGTGVSCTVVSPGVTATEFLQVAGQEKTLYQRMFMMDSPTVARLGIRAMLKRRYSIITGWMNWLVAMSVRFTPVPIVTAMTHRLMKN